MKKVLLTFLSLFLVAGLNAQTISDSLKAHYPFNKNLKDITKYGNHLAVNGGIGPYVFVAGVDSALSFTGSDRITSISKFDASSFTEMAITIWIKTSTLTTSSDQLVLQGANIGFGMGLKANSGKLYAFFDGSSSGSYLSKNALTDGNWHCIVMQTTGSTTSVYIDGVLDGSVAESLYSPSGGSDNQIYIGASTFNTKGYTGSVNDLRIYNRILSTNEIDTLVLKSLSISDLGNYKTSKFSVFPNPSSTGYFSVELNDVDAHSLLKVADAAGRLIWQGETCSEKSCKVDCKLTSGVYFVSIQTNGIKRAVKKLIVQ